MELSYNFLPKFKGRILDELRVSFNIFLEELTYIFFPLEIKVFFLNHKNVYFLNLFCEMELMKSLSPPFLHKFLKVLAKKICDVMWGWKVSTWRTECSNYLPKSHHDCNLRWIQLYVLLQKCPRVEFFIGYLLQMLRANDFDRDGCSKFIGQFHCRKMKAFLFAGVIAKKATSSETLRWRILYLFPCPSNP